MTGFFLAELREDYPNLDDSFGGAKSQEILGRCDPSPRPLQLFPNVESGIRMEALMAFNSSRRGLIPSYFLD